MGVNDITHSSASVIIETNKICKVFYAIALKGTDTPSFNELRYGGPAQYANT